MLYSGKLIDYKTQKLIALVLMKPTVKLTCFCLPALLDSCLHQISHKVGDYPLKLK
jgi:hypothetical protein